MKAEVGRMRRENIYDRDNFSIFIFCLLLVFSSLFDLHSSLLLLRFRPLAGNWVWNTLYLSLFVNILLTLFPSPCGELGMKPQPQTSMLWQRIVSVPLRGIGYETPKTQFFYKSHCSKVSVPLQGDGCETYSSRASICLMAMLCFRPLAG